MGFPAPESVVARLGDDAGVSAVEFGVASPVLVLLLLGLVDFGLAIDTKLQLEKLVSRMQLEAPRYDSIAAFQPLLADETKKLTDPGQPATYIDGLQYTIPPTVTMVRGCPDKAGAADFADPTLTAASTCTVNGAEVNPYTYYVITIQARYRLPFGIDRLPFLPDVDFSSVELPVGGTVLVDGG